jgi:hypothetical protein
MVLYPATILDKRGLPSRRLLRPNNSDGVFDQASARQQFCRIGGRVNVHVVCYSGHKADERPVRFQLGDRDYFVEQLLEVWYGPDDTYFTVRADYGNLSSGTGRRRRKIAGTLKLFDNLRESDAPVAAHIH